MLYLGEEGRQGTSRERRNAMSSQQMKTRLHSISDATYRALDHWTNQAWETEQTSHWHLVGVWTMRYSAINSLFRMALDGASDREINLLWEALRPETLTLLDLTRFGMYVRAQYPKPKKDALSLVNAREYTRQMQLLRAQQRLDYIRMQKIKA